MALSETYYIRSRLCCDATERFPPGFTDSNLRVCLPPAVTDAGPRFDIRPYLGIGRCHEEIDLFFGFGPVVNDLVGDLAGDFLQVVELPNERAGAQGDRPQIDDQVVHFRLRQLH